MLTTKRYFRPFWQGVFLTTAICLLGAGTARAITDEVVDYSPAELEELVGPVALYPDDLIAVILPASSYPLQIVEAARYLEELEDNPELQPDEDWDDSVIALLNYPEVIELMNEDLDWTWSLGEAVVNQQADVLDAIQDFRGRAALAGNLKSDERQIVTHVDEIIEIDPIDPEVIYVPYYEPSRVVVYQPRPVYHYYPRPYPLYYYPYPVHYSFSSGFFWGVTTAFTIGWLTDRVHYHYYDYASHPYYGHHYATHYYSPYAHRVRHHYYAEPRRHVVYDRKHYGNTWKPSHRHGHRPVYRRTDRHQTTAANYMDSRRHEGPVASERMRTTGSRHATKRYSEREDARAKRARASRKRNEVEGDTDRRRRSERTASRSRVATAEKPERKVTSPRTRATRSRSGGNQVTDRRSERRTLARSNARTPRSAQRSDTRRLTARETRSANSTPVSRSATRVSKPAKSAQRSMARTKPRQASRSERSTERVASQRRSSIRAPARSTTRIASAGRTARSQSVGSQPRQASRSGRSAKPASSKPRGKAKASTRSATRVASAPRTARSPGARSRSRGIHGSTRRGHRR